MKIRAMKKINRTVEFSEVAYQKMMCYTNSVKTEIGWLGTAYKKNDNNYFIDDVWLLNQEVHGTTAELSVDGIGDLMFNELDGCENKINNLKAWGHSHNCMGVIPSAQDEKQMEMFESGGHDFFIRLITNHKGEIGITIFDYESGFIYDDVEWDVRRSEYKEQMLESAYKQIEYYESLINKMLNTSDINEEDIKAEISRKVKIKKFELPKATKYNSKYDYNPYEKYDDIFDNYEEDLLDEWC